MPAQQDVIIVNASPLLTDEEVEKKVKPLQRKFDRDFYPSWAAASRIARIPEVTFHFATAKEIPRLPKTAWPIFLNRHSKEANALGWHDYTDGKAYSRVFVGDCIRLGLDWSVTLSHEVDELILDPNIHRVWVMSNGEQAALEACDPVEADEYGYTVNGQKMSDFVLPAYFSTSAEGPWDFRKHLEGPCPTLTPGGYQSITRGGRWVQIFANEEDRIPSARALMNGHRRLARGLALSPTANVLRGDLA